MQWQWPDQTSSLHVEPLQFNWDRTSMLRLALSVAVALSRIVCLPTHYDRGCEVDISASGQQGLTRWGGAREAGAVSAHCCWVR